MTQPMSMIVFTLNTEELNNASFYIRRATARRAGSSHITHEAEQSTDNSRRRERREGGRCISLPCGESSNPPPEDLGIK